MLRALLSFRASCLSFGAGFESLSDEVDGESDLRTVFVGLGITAARGRIRRGCSVLTGEEVSRTRAEGRIDEFWRLRVP